MLYKSVEESVESFKRSLSSSESDYTEDCWIVFKMAVEFNKIYTIDLEEEPPPLPWNVSERQGYMIRQTLLDFAIQLKDEKDSQK